MRTGAPVIVILDQIADDPLALCRFQVQRQRFFVTTLGISPQRDAIIQFTPLAQRIAIFQSFDFYHFSTELPQQAGSVRTGDQRTGFDNLDVMKRGLLISK